MKVLFNIINLTAEEGGEVESLLKEGCWSASHPVCRVRGAVRIKNHKKNKKSYIVVEFQRRVCSNFHFETASLLYASYLSNQDIDF